MASFNRLTVFNRFHNFMFALERDRKEDYKNMTTLYDNTKINIYIYK